MPESSPSQPRPSRATQPAHGSHVVCYSLTLPADVARPDLIWQLEASLESLRRVAPALRVRLFFYGSIPTSLHAMLRAMRVHVTECPAYGVRLRQLLPAAAPVLEAYPLLHKMLNFTALAAEGPSRVLLADCDTLFFDDPARLFDGYRDADCVAREEPTTARSHVGYDPAYVDEAALQRLGHGLGIAVTPPFNIGVMLLNAATVQALARLERQFLLYSFRFFAWMADHPVDATSAAFGESAAATVLRTTHAALLTPTVRAGALPYPSANRWILDQVALWCTLGHVRGLRYCDFRIGDVAQNGEIFSHSAREPPWVVAHYFSQNLAAVDHWLRAHA